MTRYRRPLALRPAPEASVPEVAMVMAAGLGKRMRPLTATRPKPLVEVAGKPLIDHCLEKLRASGVKKVVVNVHYLANALEAHLKNRFKDLEIIISDERKQLLSELMTRLTEEAPAHFLWTHNMIWGMAKNVEFTPRPDQRINGSLIRVKQ